VAPRGPLRDRGTGYPPSPPLLLLRFLCASTMFFGLCTGGESLSETSPELQEHGSSLLAATTMEVSEAELTAGLQYAREKNN
jgi:hypothetical protein